ncbi:metallophosphoesterase [Aurantiacibacter suaedae]|uniref:metallophosphoesterase n=1 Tax=Aurantiacibacter suaedae TaxID=2545755 RepID=UPI0010F4785C|nr:metallophosphoesterase [Aurantiacibacter suaedae]
MTMLNPFRTRLPRTAEGERIYAVGDVHGRVDLLVKLLNLIVDHYPAMQPAPRSVTLVFLGDIIDRGPSSAACVRAVHNLCKGPGATMLLGNHEDMMLASIDGNPEAQAAWLQNGGLATLQSYGIAPPSADEDSFDFGERLARGIPDDHVTFLRSLETSYRSGSYFFCHAGVRPGVSLNKQMPEDLYSIRSEFTDSQAWHGAVVVHGHSIVDGVEIRRNRIGCDTGAYASGRLSCICLQDDLQAVLQT